MKILKFVSSYSFVYNQLISKNRLVIISLDL